MKLCLDKGVFTTKPSDDDMKQINNRITLFCVNIKLSLLAEHLTQPNGRTWSPAYFKADADGHVTCKEK